MTTTIASHTFELTAAEFRDLGDVVHRYSGVTLHTGKMDLVRAHIARQLDAGAFQSVAEYIGRMRRDVTVNEMTLLIDAITTNLTGFFREEDHFRYLRDTFLPALVARKRRTGNRRIRAWSAGCSSGEEPYTMAMVLNDVLDRGGTWDAKILATDISTRVLQIAKTGSYRQDRLRDVPETLANRYFVRDVEASSAGQTAFAVKPVVRELVSFRRLNLMDDPWPFSGTLDAIFCRNVMIYFDSATQQRLVERYWDKLDSGGLFFTGHAESLAGISHGFRSVGPTVYEKP